MRLSAKTDYGVRAIFDLAMNYGQGQVQGADIARRQNIPEQYLVQLLTLLRRAGYVKSLRGPKGGHTIAKEPSAITVGHIVELLEGPIDPIEVPLDPQNGDNYVLQEVWNDLREAIIKMLYSINFGELCERKRQRDKSLTFHI